jgi:hypothetical protein
MSQIKANLKSESREKDNTIETLQKDTRMQVKSNVNYTAVEKGLFDLTNPAQDYVPAQTTRSEKLIRHTTPSVLKSYDVHAHRASETDCIYHSANFSSSHTLTSSYQHHPFEAHQYHRLKRPSESAFNGGNGGRGGGIVGGWSRLQSGSETTATTEPAATFRAPPLLVAPLSDATISAQSISLRAPTLPPLSGAPVPPPPPPPTPADDPFHADWPHW